MNQSAPAFYPEPRHAQLPRCGHQHRTLVRWVRAVEGDMVADLGAVAALDKLAVLIELAPFTATARELARDWLCEGRVALQRHLPPGSS